MSRIDDIAKGIDPYPTEKQMLDFLASPNTKPMTDNQTTEKPLQSIDLTRAELTLSLSKEGLAYQTLLQECENVVFNRDNLNEERTALVNLRKVKSKLTAAENPWTERWKAFNDAKKSLLDPVAALLTKKEGEYKKIAAELAEEARKAELERQRVARIKNEIDLFFVNQSQAIANATDAAELVRIQQLIGSHTGNISRYAEFLPLLRDKAAKLTDLIKQQKDALKRLSALKTAEKAAELTGDDQAVLDAREAQEQISAKISENAEVVQSTAINMATATEVTEVEVIAPVAPKPRRSVWKWKIIDEKAATKRGWTKVVPNEDLIDARLAEAKNDGIEVEEWQECGVMFYLEKSY